MVNDPNHKTVLLGTEFDRELRANVKEALEKMGAKYIDSSWGNYGSQIVETFDFKIESRPLHLEAETYEGLTVSGPADLVDQLTSMVGPVSERKS